MVSCCCAASDIAAYVGLEAQKNYALFKLIPPTQSNSWEHFLGRIPADLVCFLGRPCASFAGAPKGGQRRAERTFVFWMCVKSTRT